MACFACTSCRKPFGRSLEPLIQGNGGGRVAKNTESLSAGLSDQQNSNLQTDLMCSMDKRLSPV